MKLTLNIVQLSRKLTTIIPNETLTLAKLLEEVTSQLQQNVHSDIQNANYALSLNGITPLNNSDDLNISLSSLGIVEGDRIYVIAIPANYITHAIPLPQSVDQPMEGVLEQDDPFHSYCVSNPFTVDDSSVTALPSVLSQLISDHKAELETESDWLMVVIHCLMLELGFVASDNALHNNDYPSDTDETRQINGVGFHYSLLQYYKDMPQQRAPSNGVYSWKYCIRSCPEAQVTLLGVNMGRMIYFHVVSPFFEEKYSVHLKKVIYVHPTNSVPTAKLQNLSELSMTFKDFIGLPTIVSLSREFNNIRCRGHCIDLLPEELLLKVLAFLDDESLTRTSRTTGRLGDIAHDPLLWRQRCKKFYQLPTSLDKRASSRKSNFFSDMHIMLVMIKH